jgi:phage-related protein
MATFTWTPKYGAARKATPKVLISGFGDGYRQRAADGINNIDETWDLEFVNEDTTIDDIDDFLVARGGWESFDWTPPGEAVSKKWSCAEWGRTKTGSGVDSLNASFQREYDL